MFKLSVNGRSVGVDVGPETPLIYVLRNDLALNGPKLGCGSGLCGACTVHVDGRSVRACQMRLKALHDGARIVTLDGLGTPDRPHPLQAAFIAEQALQCGYCTYGMIMEAAALLADKPSPSAADIIQHMNANLCRCGCQQRVVRAIRAMPGVVEVVRDGDTWEWWRDERSRPRPLPPRLRAGSSTPTRKTTQAPEPQLRTRRIRSCDEKADSRAAAFIL